MNKKSLLDTIKKHTRWSKADAYPSCEGWKLEGDKLLEFAKQENILNYYMSRIKTDSSSQRDETLNELRAGYFLKKWCGASFIKWHPNKGQGEFIISFEGHNIFCEVKSPGWEGEVAKEQGNNSPRLRKPKYIHAETKGVDNSPYIMSTINKAYNKFPNNIPTLLIIIDDFWMDCFNDGLCIDRALYRPKLPTPYVDNKPEGVFVCRNYERLGGVLFINLNLMANGDFVWKIHIAPNGNAISQVQLPTNFINIIESVRVLDNDLVEIYKIKNGWLEKSYENRNDFI